FREIMMRVYKDALAGTVPQFPREMEERIEETLAAPAGAETAAPVAHLGMNTGRLPGAARSAALPSGVIGGRGVRWNLAIRFSECCPHDPTPDSSPKQFRWEGGLHEGLRV